MQRIEVKATISYSLNKGPNLFKTIDYPIDHWMEALVMLFATQAWRELNSGNLEIYGITFSFRRPMSTQDASLPNS